MSTVNDLFKAVDKAIGEHHTSDLSFKAKIDAPAGIDQGILSVHR